MPGVNRLLCFFLHWGDLLAVKGLQARADCTTWLLPWLRSTKTPGQTVGNMIKDLCPGGADRFERFHKP